MSEPVLFIGGPLDGERRVMQTDLNHFETAVSPSARARWGITPSDRSTFELIRYYRLRFTGICFFVMEGMSPEDVMMALVERYPRPVPKSRYA